MSALSEWGGVSSAIVALGGKNDPWAIQCKLCDVRLESKATWLQHFDSKRHKLNARQSNLAPTGFPLGKGAAAGAAPHDDGDDEHGMGSRVGSGTHAARAGQHTTSPPPYHSATASGVPVPRSKLRSPTSGADAPFNIAQALTQQLAARRGAGGGDMKSTGALPAEDPRKAPPGKGSAVKQQPRPATQPIGFLTRPAGAAADTLAASPPPPAPLAPPAADSPQHATSSRQDSAVVFTTAVVNADKARNVDLSVSQAPAVVSAPLVDPKLDRNKARSLAWLKAPVVQLTPNAERLYDVVISIPTSLYKVLKHGQAVTVDPSEVSLHGDSNLTTQRLAAAFEAIEREVPLDDDREGLMTTLRPKAAMPLSTARTLESFFNAAVCFAPYEDPVQTRITTTARVDHASFWS